MVKSTPRLSASLFSPFCQGGKISSGYCGSSARHLLSSLAAESVGSVMARMIRLPNTRVKNRTVAFLGKFLFGILKAGPLQFREGRNRSGGENNTRQQVIGQFGGQLLVVELVGIAVGPEQRGRLFPDRVVARQKDDAPLHQHRNRII